ncbi:MAG: 7-carboxy-7-deazaguanine synthase QueE [Synechocystis sp.]
MSSMSLPTPTKTYPIVETFHSLQGEGTWAGCSAFFIRLAGCDVHCPWCDQKETWPVGHHPHTSVETLVTQALAAKPAFVVITGGEPLMHDLTDLCAALKHHQLRCHLETSGAYPLSGTFDWITLSHKPYKPPVPTIYSQASELKMVIAQLADLSWAEREGEKVDPQIPRFLQPEWETPTSQALIFDYILTHPHWRLSLQSHKYLGVR